MLQALDTVNGGVMAVEEGKASRKFRQTASVQIEIGEDALLDLYQEAIAAAVPGIEKQLKGKLNDAGKIKVWITTSADPAMIEFDGVLPGDHILTVTRPGYETITKKLMLDSSMKITVPMISNQLSAEERKEALSNMNLRLWKIH